ncbi:MAG: metallophosphoesterase [Pontiellaceae bacterium]|nr:metallophosphoesterase [Pontiellaceae bacterium]
MEKFGGTRGNRISLISYTLLLCSVWGTGWCAKIVYPWRATTAIVKTNETFEVWFSADSGQNLNSVQLKGLYNTVNAVVTSTNTSTWVYDQMSGNTCNRKYTVKVPYGSPADRYDLVLKTSTGDVTSPAAVKVIREYKSSYYIVHTTDDHRWQAGYDPTNITREAAAIINAANIMDAEMIIGTGDIYYPNANSAATDAQRIEDMFNGWVAGSAIKGLNDAYAAVFMVPGNHDTTLKSYENEPDLATPARDWNKRFGLQSHNFKYGNGRFVGVNNSWCRDTGGSSATYDWQLNAAKSWLGSVGTGNFRVTYAHVPQESVPPIYNALNSVGAAPKLMLAGHTHNPDLNPMQVNGTSASIVYVGDTMRDLKGKGPFNLYKVNATSGTFEAVGNTKAVNQALEVEKNYSSDKLKLSYSLSNNGTLTNNTATITNKFTFPVSGARIRFVMKRGTYTVNTGTIKQQFDGTLSGANVTVVDVSVDVSANGTKAVSISPVGGTIPPVGSIITLKACNGKYVSATYSTNNTLIANKTTLSNYERFKVVNATNCVALQCMGNSKFVSIDTPDGSKPMLANRSSIGSYEKFSLVQSGSQIAIRSVKNTNYVSAVSTGVAPLRACQTYIGSYEKFTWKVE